MSRRVCYLYAIIACCMICYAMISFNSTELICIRFILAMTQKFQVQIQQNRTKADCGGSIPFHLKLLSFLTVSLEEVMNKENEDDAV